MQNAVLNFGNMLCDESWIYCYDPETKTQSSQWNYAGSASAKKARQSKYTNKLWLSLFWLHWHDLHALGSPWTEVNKEYYVEVLWEFRKRFCRKRPALFKSGQWHFQQDNAPVHKQEVIIQASFVKDVGTLFIISNFIFSSFLFIFLVSGSRE